MRRNKTVRLKYSEPLSVTRRLRIASSSSHYSGMIVHFVVRHGSNGWYYVFRHKTPLSVRPDTAWLDRRGKPFADIADAEKYAQLLLRRYKNAKPLPAFKPRLEGKKPKLPIRLIKSLYNTGKKIVQNFDRLQEQITDMAGRLDELGSYNRYVDALETAAMDLQDQFETVEEERCNFSEAVLGLRKLGV